MGNKIGKTNRRGFLAGMAGVGAAAAVAAASSRVKAAVEPAEQKPSGPTLYKRGPEAERYYKTLYR